MVAPLLSNIYLNELDDYMVKYIDRISSKEKLISKVNPKMANMTKKLSKLHEQLRNTEQGVERKEILRNIKLVRKTRNTFPSRIRTGVRVYYVRYADD